MRRGLSAGARRRLFAAGVLAALAAAAVFRAAWVEPRRDLLAMRRAELQQRRAELVEARRAAGRLPGLEAQVERLGRRREALGRALPGPREASALLRRLQEVAAQAGLTTETFALSAVEPRERFEEWPVRLELSGGFRALTRFLDEVRRLPWIVTVSRMSVRAHGPGARAATIAVTCTASTYVLRGPERTAGAAGGGEGPLR